ncbi:alpha/beta hydrolase family protein [Actinocrispum wychmicini]|uniref:Platelet-activating factor acetylhydrolase isoform II n=1 Tax=Actinocrispum wychmicini TaxID=1213861 RepID=A0A4R2IMU0_9PSEU|nr:hydrolase [Actinocrispum wychmicini]TCO45288.1 platelet-activating factor acetylhydrolase isoform II [Actinocrispum wychmicini]
MKSFLVAAVAAGAMVAPQQPLQLTLPGPTGPYAVGTVPLHLIDPARHDPWDPSGAPRELMISLWYPTRSTTGFPRAPWLPPAAAAQFARDNGLRPDAVRVPVTHGHTGAPVSGCGGGLPVVVYSHGNGGSRSDSTIVVEELASRGYFVVTVDHTGDSVTEFPDGRVPDRVNSPANAAAIQAARVADVRFVLDKLAVLNSGGNPSDSSLPDGLTGALDLGDVGMFGYSAGGPTTASTMDVDGRVKAGLSLDGPVFGPVIDKGLDRPYMLVDARASRATIPELQTFWEHLTNWRLNIGMQGAKHLTYSDFVTLIPQAAGLLGLTPAQVEQQIGAVVPARAIAVQRAYPLAFFDLHLRHRGHLLDRPSPLFPEVHFIP